MSVDAEICQGFTKLGEAYGGLLYRVRLAMEVAKVTESPIETLLGAEMIARFARDSAFEVRAPWEEKSFTGNLLLMPQYPWARYRVDWALKTTWLRQPYIFIECDGADFHTSDDQIAKDKQRDAEMIAAGISVLRFTGSEIDRATPRCVARIISEINRRCDAENQFLRGAA